MIQLSESQLMAIIKDAIKKNHQAAADNQITEMEEQRPREKLLTIHELCGIFNKDRRACEKLGIPRVVLGPNDYRYDPADVKAFIQGRKERSQ